MRKSRTYLALLCLSLFGLSACNKNKVNPSTDLTAPEGTFTFDESPQRKGDPIKGFDYLIYGDFLDSGIPLPLYRNTQGQDVSNFLRRTGENATLPYNITAVNSWNDVPIAVANCFQCHAQKLNGDVILGLGNSLSNYTDDQGDLIPLIDFGINFTYGNPSDEWDAYAPFRRALTALAPEIILSKRGVNPADKIAAVLAIHRNPDDLKWNDNPMTQLPDEVVPTDVPAWWLLKKKNTMFATGVGQGDFARLMMASSILTLQDSSKAREVDEQFVDVVAWINQLDAPKFPERIDQSLADNGEQLFLSNCAKCHGTYGEKESYPNLLVPLDLVKTDPLLTTSNFAYPELVSWYNESWFGQAPHAAKLVPELGYVAPPLDGVWATAPYLHNGSIPTLEDLLDSSQRPKYFKRTFNESDYNLEKVGWNYTTEEETEDIKTYDTTLRGYSNQGHLFGDSFTEVERTALIEYLKTL